MNRKGNVFMNTANRIMDKKDRQFNHQTVQNTLI